MDYYFVVPEKGFEDFKVGDLVKIPYSYYWPNKFGKVIASSRKDLTLEFNGQIGIYSRNRHIEWIWK